MPSAHYPSISGRTVSILGAGVLGRRIACCWVAGGYHVRVRDPDADQRAAAKDYVEKNAYTYNLVVGKKPGTIEVFEELAPSVVDAWMVIEAVPEKLQIKIDTFADLEKYAPADALLCSNSSSYRSSEMLVELQKPETAHRVLNTHYMMPPGNIIVELMTDGQTSTEVFPFLVHHLRKIGLHPIVAHKESTGFVFNRVWAAVKRECLTVLSEGVSTPAELDSVWVEMFGNSTQGPCERMDDVGLDTVAFIEEHYIKERGLPSKDTVEYLQKHFIQEGRLGAKSDKGGLYPADSCKVSSKGAQNILPKAGPVVYFLDIGLSNSPDVAFDMGRVLVGDADGHNVHVLVDHQHMPDGLTASKKTGRLYWTSMGWPSKNDGSVYSCKVDGSDIKTILPTGAVHTPKQICIDELNDKIYVSDREGMRVHRCNMDGTDKEILITSGNELDEKSRLDQSNWCVGIAVSPAEGKFYWTQKGPSKGSKGRIFRAHINMPAGSSAANRSDIECIFQNLPEPIDLDIDYDTNTLYWTDRGEIPRGNSLNQASISELQNLSVQALDDAVSSKQKNNYTELARNLHEAIGLKVDHVNGQIYTTDLGGCVYRFDIDGKRVQRLYEYQGAFTGITLVP